MSQAVPKARSEVVSKQKMVPRPPGKYSILKPLTRTKDGGHRSEDHDSAGRVDAVSQELPGGQHVVLSAHPEEDEAEYGEGQEEKSGKNVVRRSNKLLRLSGALIRCGWTEGDAEREDS